MEIALSINDLKKTYQGGVTALKGISFEVQQGDFMALLGPNGAGKSKISVFICSLIKKSCGLLRIFDDYIYTNF